MTLRLVAASILAARKLAQLDSLRRSPAFESVIADAITTAERITSVGEKIQSDFLRRAIINSFFGTSIETSNGCLPLSFEVGLCDEFFQLVGGNDNRDSAI
jgi:hypothetical protein